MPPLDFISSGRWSRMDRKEMGKRTVRVGWKGREKRLDLYKQQSKVKKDELIDSKRGMHLEELSSNDGSSKSSKKPKLLERLHRWHKARQKVKFKDRLAQVQTEEPFSQATNIRDTTFLKVSSPFQIFSGNKLDLNFSFKKNIGSISVAVQSNNEVLPDSTCKDQYIFKSENRSVCNTYLENTAKGKEIIPVEDGVLWSLNENNRWKSNDFNFNKEKLPGETSDVKIFSKEDEVDGVEDLREHWKTTTNVQDGDQDCSAVVEHCSMARLWCEQIDVIASGVLTVLSANELKRQEAMFELLSSEVSYLLSLDVLIHHFMESPGISPHLLEGRGVFHEQQHEMIFSNLREVREASAQFLSVLHSRRSEGVVVRNISDIILEFASGKFECYIRYCTDLAHQMRELQDITPDPLPSRELETILQSSLLQRFTAESSRELSALRKLNNKLSESNPQFRQYVEHLESGTVCQKMSLNSFLLLPMQRVTRLPLLVVAILKHTPVQHLDHHDLEITLTTVQTLVTACNNGARHTDELHEIYRKLDFKKIKPFPNMSARRKLLKQGMLIRLQVEQKLLGQVRIKKKPCHVFVFNDYIAITKRKKDSHGDEVYCVKDYASLDMIKMEYLNAHMGGTLLELDHQDFSSRAAAAVSAANTERGILLMFQDSAVGEKDGYILLADNDSDITLWVETIVGQNCAHDD